MAFSKEVVITCDESDILQVIIDHFGRDLGSLVADQELGNQVWVTGVQKDTKFVDWDRVTDWIATGKGTYLAGDLMDILCSKGVLEEGEYQIDCTW